MSEENRELIEHKLEIITNQNPYPMPFEAFEIQRNGNIWRIETEVGGEDYGFELVFESKPDERDVHYQLSRAYENMTKALWKDFVYTNAPSEDDVE
jgi:hypothetical protein